MSTANTPTIIMVEDDLRFSELVSRYLTCNGISVTLANLSRSVVDQVHEAVPDLVILDLGLPAQDGLSICRELRPAYSNPILILTARGGDIDQVLGLELGADDYVIKPVEPRVLLARIRALLRRGAIRQDSEQRILRFGYLAINTIARTVSLGDQAIPFSSGEFDLLVHMAAHAGEIQSRESLFRRLYRREYNGANRILDIRISQLRKKLGDDADSPRRIKTVWGRGYLFVPGAW